MAVAQWVRAFPQQTLVVKTGCDSSTTKRDLSVADPRRLLKFHGDCHYKRIVRITVGLAR